MSETRITFLKSGYIEGFADSSAPYRGTVTEPNSLYWHVTPPLTDSFQRDKVIGTITKLEYRDGKLWCEAFVHDYIGISQDEKYRFGVAFMVEEYEFKPVKGGEQLHVTKGELIEIAIIPESGVDGVEIPL